MLLLAILFFGFASYSFTSTDPFSRPDTTITQHAEAAQYVEAHLGHPLPADTIVLGVFEGGFQDRFVQIKLSTPAASLPDLLMALDVDAETLREIAPNPFPSENLWWDIQTHSTVQRAEATFGHFHTAAVSIVADPEDASRILIYIAASEM